MTAAEVFDQEYPAEWYELPGWMDRAQFVARHAGETPDKVLMAFALAWGRESGPDLLATFWADGHLSPVLDTRDRDQLQAVLADIWLMADYPEQKLERELWFEMFDAAQYPKPSAPIVVYRGAAEGRRDGMAWTTEQERATWFAKGILGRLDGMPGYVYRAVAPPAAVLCLVDEVVEGGGRNEREVIVNPAGLLDVQVVDGPF